jgi:hypothetical protein
MRQLATKADFAGDEAGATDRISQQFPAAHTSVWHHVGDRSMGYRDNCEIK